MTFILRTQCALSIMNDLFQKELKKIKESNRLTQKQLCEDLCEVPHRTLQSWLQGEKSPPSYVQKLVLDKLSAKYTTN